MVLPSRIWKRFQSWSLPTRIGIVLGVFGLFGGGGIYFQFGNDYYISAPKRSFDAIRADLITILGTTTNNVFIKVSLADSETSNFASKIKEFLDSKGFTTQYSYCLRPEPLPDGMFFSRNENEVTFFIGVSDGTYEFNQVKSLDLCSVETNGMEGAHSSVPDFESFMQAGVSPLNQNPDPLPVAKSYSTSSGIFGPCIDGFNEDENCLRPAIFVRHDKLP